MYPNYGKYNKRVCTCTQTEAIDSYRQMVRLIYDISGEPNNLTQQYTFTYNSPRETSSLYGPVTWNSVLTLTYAIYSMSKSMPSAYPPISQLLQAALPCNELIWISVFSLMQKPAMSSDFLIRYPFMIQFNSTFQIQFDSV